MIKYIQGIYDVIIHNFLRIKGAFHDAVFFVFKYIQQIDNVILTFEY